MNPPNIDRERLDLVCMGNAELARELIDMLIDEARPLIGELGPLVAANDAGAVREKAHAVKGIAGNVGAARLQAAALLLERAAADGTGGLDELLAGAAGAFAELCAEHEQAS